MFQHVFFCTCLSHWLDPKAQFSQSSKLQIQIWPSKTDSLHVYQWLLSLTDQWRDLIPFVKHCTNITDWQPTSDRPMTMSWLRTSRNDIGIPDGWTQKVLHHLMKILLKPARKSNDGCASHVAYKSYWLSCSNMNKNSNCKSNILDSTLNC